MKPAAGIKAHNRLLTDRKILHFTKDILQSQREIEMELMAVERGPVDLSRARRIE